MKLRFGIDAAAQARIHEALDARCEEPPVGRKLSYIYLDTPDGALAERGVALRFRRSTALGIASPRRPWRWQALWPKDFQGRRKIKKLGISRLRQRLDAAFDIRIERWTWAVGEGRKVSLDQSAVSTGSARETFAELRVVCRKKDRDAAMAFAVELGATHLASTKARERGQELLAHPGEASPGE